MIETSSNLKYFDKRQSDGAIIQNNEIIVVHYMVALTMEDLDKGPWLENTWTENRPVTFRLGSHQMIFGIEEGLQNMKVAMFRRLIVPSHLAFGELGIPGKIPPNATLYFEIYVVETKN